MAICDLCGGKSTMNATKTNKGVMVRVDLCNMCYILWKMGGDNVKIVAINNHLKKQKL